jgi:voltage-gated potassium channel
VRRTSRAPKYDPQVQREAHMTAERARWRDAIRDVIDGRAGRVSTVFDTVILVLILVSVIETTLETVPNLPPSTEALFAAIELFCTIAFSAEYIARAIAAERWYRYSFSLLGLIDLLAILPSILALGFDLRGLRAIRLFRVFRLLKIVRYQQALHVYREAFRMVREEIMLFLIMTLVLLFFASTGIYYFESDAQPDKFGSIPEAMWWAVATITTVGYGDVYPITPGGRIFTFCVLIIGIGLVAVPSGLMASSISQARKQIGAAADGASARS